MSVFSAEALNATMVRSFVDLPHSERKFYAQATSKLNRSYRLRAIPFSRKARSRQDELLLSARASLSSGQTMEGVAILFDLVNYDADCEEAWRLLVRYQPRIEQQIDAQKQLVRLRPKDPRPRSDLKALQKIRRNPLALAHYYSQIGQHGLAIEASNQAIDRAEQEEDVSLADRAAQVRKESTLRSQESHIRLIYPMANVVRLALGPIVLYLLMMVVQGGFSLKGIQPIWLLGIVSVGFGGLLVAAADERPMKPPWIGGLWPSGHQAPSRIAELFWIAGVMIILISFALLFVDAVGRVGFHQAG